MGGAASAAKGAGDSLGASLGKLTKPSGMELDPDDEQDTLARNLGEENYDEKKLKKEHAKYKSGFQEMTKRLNEQEAKHKELTGKLNEMFNALKLLQAEKQSVASDLEKAEARIQANANPEREAYIQKYALEKLREEYEGYKKQVEDGELKTSQELRRLQENLAGRSLADEAAKQALAAELRELRREKSIAGGVPGAEAATHDKAGYAGDKAKKGAGDGKEGKGGKGGFNPSSGLKPKTIESAKAATIKVDTLTVDGDHMDTTVEAKRKKREAAVITGKAYLVEKGVLPPEDAADAKELDDAAEEAGFALEAEEKKVLRVVDCVFDQVSADLVFGGMESAVAQACAKEEDADFERVDVPITSSEVYMHGLMVHSFGTHHADAYGTEPYIARMDEMDRLVDFATSRDRGVGVILGKKGSGKSFLLAAVATSLYREAMKSIICPLFVGASAGSRDTRILVKTLCEIIADSLPNSGQSDREMRAATAMQDAQGIKTKDEVVHTAEKVHSRPKRKIPESLDDLKAALPALIAEARKARKTVVVVLDGIPELHDYYSPTVLEWLPPLLGDAVVIMSLEKEDEVHELEQQAQVDELVEVGELDPEQRTAFLTYLVTKHDTAVGTELARQKDEMRKRAETEFKRLQEERMQRRLQRERLRGPSKKRGKKKKKKSKGDEEADTEEVAEEPGEDKGLLGEYEIEVMMEKKDSGNALYMVLAVEFLTSLERNMPALEEATVLPGTLTEMMDHMFDLLEDQHGKELVRAALMFLESARHGLTQAELLQLLQSSEREMEDKVQLDDAIDLENELLVRIRAPNDWFKFIRDLAPLLKPRNEDDVRGSDLRLRHSAIKGHVLSRYCTHKCFWHRSSSVQDVHKLMSAFFQAALERPAPGTCYPDEGELTPFERWVMSEQVYQYAHACSDLVFHLLQGGSWKGVEDTLTSLRFIEEKCRAVDPYHLQTDYSAALDSSLVTITENDDSPGLSYLQRVRVKDFGSFIKTYAAVFRSHPELVIQQAANMADDSPVSKAAMLIVSDVTVETAWFKYINKSQLGDPCQATLKCNGPVECICYSPDGRKIASGSGDGFGGRVIIWDARSGAELQSYSMPGALKSMQFSGDGKLLMNVSDEGTVVLIDMMSWKERARQVIADTNVSAGALAIDGKKMVLVSRDGIINLWDLHQQTLPGGVIQNRFLKMFEILDEDEEGRPCPMTFVAISPNVKKVFTGSSGGLMKIFDLSMTEGLSVLHVLPGHDSVVTFVNFSSDGHKVATSCLDCKLKIWDVDRGGNAINTFEDKHEIRGCFFSPDGTFLCGAMDNGVVELFDIATGQRVMTFGNHSGRVQCVCFAPNGKYICSGGVDGLVKIWGISDSAAKETFTGHENTDITSVCYSADGGEVCTTGGDGSIKLWGGKRGAELMSFPGHEERIQASKFSPLVKEELAGVVTASIFDGTYRLWNNLTGTETDAFRHSSNYTCSLAFSPSGLKVMSGSFDGSVIIWDMETQKMHLKLGVEMDGQGGWRVERIRDRHEDAVVCCEFHPNEESERAVTASLDGTLRVWNTRWGNCVATLKGHSAAINGVCYSKDGTRMFSASSDGTVREWMSDAPFKCMSIIIGHYGPVHDVVIATSGMHLFSVSEDCTLRAWLRVQLDEAPAPNTPATRAGSRPFTTGKKAGSAADSGLEWFQWQQVAIFASPFPLRCVAGSLGEEDEEVSCGGANGAVFLLRLMLPGDT